MKAILYSRPGCHLCDHARKTLESHGVDVTEIDIDRQREIRERYDHCIPVVEIGGKVRFRGKVHPVLLRRLLANERGVAAGISIPDAK